MSHFDELFAVEFNSIYSCAALVFCAFDISGNWGVDLQAGSLYGYRLLFVVLLAGLFAVFLQVKFFKQMKHTMLTASF